MGGRRVTKGEFVDRVSANSGLSKGQTRETIDVVLNTIGGALSRGEEVNFPGFGKFQVVERGPRKGVNPRTGERITIRASRVPKFSAGAGLKAKVKVLP
jgi:DNA-binding protein HU-beta